MNKFLKKKSQEPLSKSQKDSYLANTVKKQFQKVENWPEVEQIIYQVLQKEFQIYVVGGAVRNALLKKEIKEFDLASTAKPQELLKLLPQAKDSFIKYGVVIVPLKNKQKLEITTFRKDSKNSDGRRPQSIKYTDIDEDSKRRDFTINALYYDLQKNQVIDLVEGIKDLKQKKIICIGNAKERFKEDHLRILRAVRLAHQLNFKVDTTIKQASRELKESISKISKQRVMEELNKMFSCEKIDFILKDLNDYELLPLLFPDLDFSKQNIKRFNEFYHQRFSFYNEVAFCWSVLALPFFYDHKTKYKAFLNTYPLPSKTIKQSVSYLESIQTLIDSKNSLADKLIAFNKQHKQVYELIQALLNTKIIKHKLSELNLCFNQFKKIAIQGQLPQALVKGSELLKIKPAIKKQHFSKILKQAYSYQIENPKLNKSQLLKKINLLKETKS